jgi:hypothetical protein
MALDIGRILNDIMSQLGPLLEKNQERKERRDWLNYLNTRELENVKGENAVKLQQATDTGALARQRLINQGSRDVADVNAGASIFTARENRMGEKDKATIAGEASKYHSDKIVDAYQGRGNDPSKIIEATTKAGITSTPDQVLDLRKRLLNQNTGDTMSRDSITTNDVLKFNNSAAPTPKAGGSMSFTMDSPLGNRLKPKQRKLEDYMN